MLLINEIRIIILFFFLLIYDFLLNIFVQYCINMFFIYFMILWS
ncbi:hypothetical protein EMIT036CA2_11286 [Chryseobacterium sp. IT-36CA2]